jgi:hypothetical protein
MRQASPHKRRARCGPTTVAVSTCLGVALFWAAVLVSRDGGALSVGSLLRRRRPLLIPVMPTRDEVRCWAWVVD